MMFLSSVPVAPGARLALAGAVLLCVAFYHEAWANGADASAVAVPVLEPVVVTATRSAQSLQEAPVGASVISAAQIERSGVADANEAIRKLAGIAALSDLSNGREYSLSLRGFGETASQNVVVLVDGIRLSENELVSARLSAIPLDQIERIEILRGGNSVMWGEGASAGVINVILKNQAGREAQARVAVALESFQGSDVQLSGNRSWGAHALDASLKKIDTDGYRQNSAYDQTTGSVGYQWFDAGWRLKLRVQSEDQNARLPGSLSFAQFDADPRQSQKPDDFARSRELLTSGHLSYQGGAWLWGLDMGIKQRDSFDGYSSGYVIAKERTSRQLATHVAYTANFGGIKVLTTAGAQVQRWVFDAADSSGTEQGHQSTRAHYLRSDWALPSQTRVSLGWRQERVRKDATSGALAYDRHDRLHAHELGLGQTLYKGWDVYGRLATSYRLPTIDENRYKSLIQTLQPQRNRDQEIGLKWLMGANFANVRVFRQKTVNEIAYDSLQYANVNLDPTRRQGVELEGRWQVLPQWALQATWQQVSARFAQGPNAGREMVLTAPHTATLRSSYQIDARQTLEVGLQRVSAMRFGDDANNACNLRVPSSTRLDARYAWAQAGWIVALSGTNLTDKRSYNYAFSCAVGALYPEQGRALRLSVARQF